MPLALFLFLICALLASVVLAASTAVGGRHASLAESDQQYYSVASAVELFQKEFEETPVTVRAEVTKTVTTTSTVGGATNTSEVINGCTVTVDGKSVFSGTGSGSIATTGLSLIELTAVNVLCGGTSFNPATSLTDDMPAVSGVPERTCTITPSISGNSGVDAAKLVVTMTQKVLDDGQVQMRFDSAKGATDNAFYSLTLMCDADVDLDEYTDEGPVAMTTNGTTRTETQVVKTVREATVSFTTTELGKTFANTGGTPAAGTTGGA